MALLLLHSSGVVFDRPLPHGQGLASGQSWRRPGRGFTAIELMVVVAITAIMAAMAAPSFRESIARHRTNELASDLAATLTMARAEAIRQVTPVFVERLVGCAGDAGNDNWNCGWQLVNDANSNGTAAAAEVVQTKVAPQGFNALHTGQGARINFNRWGLAVPAGQRFVLVSADAGYARHARTLCMNGTGGVRILAGDVACP